MKHTFTIHNPQTAGATIVTLVIYCTLAPPASVGNSHHQENKGTLREERSTCPRSVSSVFAHAVSVMVNCWRKHCVHYWERGCLSNTFHTPHTHQHTSNRSLSLSRVISGCRLNSSLSAIITSAAMQCTQTRLASTARSS